MRYAYTNGLQTKPEPGELVRFTDTFVDVTRQPRPSGWRVVACTCDLCATGKHVAVNEPSLADTPEPRPRWRHISFRNLEKVTMPPGAVLSEEAAPPTVPQ